MHFIKINDKLDAFDVLECKTNKVIEHVLVGTYKEAFLQEVYRWIEQNNKKNIFLDVEKFPEKIAWTKKSFAFYYTCNGSDSKNRIIAYPNIVITKNDDKDFFTVEKSFKGELKSVFNYETKQEVVDYLTKYYKNNKLRLLI